MLSNRVRYFIRNILQNSKLNREKFVKNKKIYNNLSVKKRNYNLIAKRNYGLPPSNNNNNNNHYGFIIIASLSAYFHIYGINLF